jgi:methionine synthase I (cobalamin-dependent)
VSFLAELAAGPLLMDGAMGSQLLSVGIGDPERANLDAADHVRAIHASYARSGAGIVLTNTFQLNPIALTRHGLEARLEGIARKALQLARNGAPQAWILADVGPIITPGSKEEFTDRDALVRVLEALEGADAVLFETCSSPAALSAVQFALHRVHAVEGLPLLLSLTYYRNAAGEVVTYSGHRPETYARHAARHGVTALGVNCGKEIDVPDVCEILSRYRDHTDLPLFARPNAGTPQSQGCYPRSPEIMAAGVPSMVAAGATMLGGCCGTTPAHIAAMAAVLHPPSNSR